MTAKSRSRRRVSLDFTDVPSMTKQAFADECDINRIMAKYERTGCIDFSRDVASGRFIDLASVPDYHASMTKVAKANQAFDALPSKIRSAFHNDPAEFLSFCSNPKNAERAVELGIAVPRTKAAKPLPDEPKANEPPTPKA